MGLSLRQLLVDQTDRIHRIGIDKFIQMQRDPSRHRFPAFAGQRIRTAEAVVQLVDRKPTRMVRMTFDIFTFDHAGRLDTEAFERQQISRFQVHMNSGRGALTINANDDANIVDASDQFTARGGRWVPGRALARTRHDAALDRVKCPRL
jgi:hypothetical protein